MGSVGYGAFVGMGKKRYFTEKFQVLPLTLCPPGQNGCRFADDTFKCIFINEKCYISIQISLKFVQWGPINNKSQHYFR